MKDRRWIVLSFILFLLAAGCGLQDDSTPALTTINDPIDPEFAPLTQRLGVYAGVGIGEVFFIDGVSYQYTSNVLLVHDPKAALQDQYRLESLANYWNIAEVAVPDPQDSEQIYVNGHIVWDEAQGLYIKLGADLMGKPLTEVHYNPNYKRYEQYFENMGVFRRENEPSGNISILPYGTWTCAAQCTPEEPDYTGPPEFPDSPDAEQLLLGEAAFEELIRQSGTQFSGFPLSPAYIASDGLIEKVFENVILFWDPTNGGAADLRRLPQAVGINPSPLVPAISGMHFFPISGDLGYNLPTDFMSYISRHGTLARFGPPITELHVGPSGVTRQCYEKLCLLYDQTAPKSLVIRPEALGYQYLNSNYVHLDGNNTQAPVPPGQIDPARQLRLTTWHQADLVPPGDYQIIGAGVYDGRTPLVGAEIEVTVTLPDGSPRRYPMPLTGENGQSQVDIEPIQAEKGTLIPYQVCIINMPETQVCSNGEYIIWDE